MRRTPQIAIVALLGWLAAVPRTDAQSEQSAELPPRAAFLAEVREVLARSRGLWHHYTYTERRTELHLNPFGRMGTGDTIVIEGRPAANPQLNYRKVIERNGVPVPKHELDRQDAEYRARVARIQRDTGTDSAERREQDELLAQRRSKMMLDDVVNTLQFELERREYHNGRPMIVVSFTPKPDARPTTREGRMAKVFEGSFLIDEAAREVTDVHAVAKDDVSFGGFVAKVYAGTEAVIERREVEAGTWMPTRLTLKGNFRALFRKAKINHVTEWTDYRRLP